MMHPIAELLRLIAYRIDAGMAAVDGCDVTVPDAGREVLTLTLAVDGASPWGKAGPRWITDDGVRDGPI